MLMTLAALLGAISMHKLMHTRATSQKSAVSAGVAIQRSQPSAINLSRGIKELLLALSRPPHLLFLRAILAVTRAPDRNLKGPPFVHTYIRLIFVVASTTLPRPARPPPPSPLGQQRACLNIYCWCRWSSFCSCVSLGQDLRAVSPFILFACPIHRTDFSNPRLFV